MGERRLAPHRFAALYARRFPVSTVLLWITVAFFATEAALGGVADPEVLTRLGALRPDLLWERRELYRLVCPIFLHHGWLHMILNMLALVQLAALVEHVYDSVRTFVFYVASGIAASLASASFSPPGSVGAVGASGAILGLAGVLLGLTFFGEQGVRQELKRLLGRRLLFGVAFTLGAGLAISLVVPLIDNWAHIGGLVAGLAFAAAQPDPRRPSGALAPAAAGVLLVLTAFSWGAMAADGIHAAATFDRDLGRLLGQRIEREPDGIAAGVYLAQMVESYHRAGLPERAREELERHLDRSGDPTTVSIVVVRLMEQPGFERELDLALRRWLALAPSDPEPWNNLAWHLVTRHDEARRDPEEALALVDRALDLLEEREFDRVPERRAAYLDTRAEALFQAGRLEEARAAQREAVALAEPLEMPALPEMRARLHKIERGVPWEDGR